MTERPSDDAIRGMLEARAGGVGPDAERAVLAGARAAIGGTDSAGTSDVRFGLRPVTTTRPPSRAPLGLAAVAVAAVIAVAVFGTRPVAQPSATQAVVPSLGVAGASPSDRIVVAGSVRAEEFMHDLSAGRLDGKLAVIPGRVVVASGRCLAECTFVKIDGLPELWIAKGDRSTLDLEAAIGALTGIPVTVLRIEDAHAELVGWLAAGADDPLPANGLALVRDTVPAGGLVAVDGWLHPDGTDGVLTGISNWSPANRGGHDIGVYLDESYGTEPRYGTYLLRNQAPPSRLPGQASWHVVGTLDALTTVRVDQPRTDLAGPTIPAADVTAALKDGSLDGTVLAIDGELQTVIWDCPLDARPCLRFYVDGLPGIAVTWDGALQGSFGEAGGQVSVMEGRLLVTPHKGHLELLGRLDGALDQPVAVTDLDADEYRAGNRDPLGLLPVDGWLVAKGTMYCPMLRPGIGDPCSTGYSVLSPTAPDASGGLTSDTNEPVVIHRGAPGVGQLPIADPGPFLVREAVVRDACASSNGTTVAVDCGGGPILGWLLVARYDPATVRVVTFP